MASITSLGTGSGLDLEGIITKLMAVEKAPLTNLDSQEASYQAKISAFGTLKGGVSSLEATARTLNSTTLFSGMSAVSSDGTIVSASANSAATAGTYSLQVVDTAKAHSIASGAFGSLAGNISSVDGKIKIELGTFSGGLYTPDPGLSAKSIDISATDSSLNTIRDKINAANAGVRASIIYVGSEGYKLTLTSEATGASKSIRVTTLDSTGLVTLNNNTDIAKLSFDPTAMAGTGKEYSVSSDATDAHLKINGVDIYRSSNTISDAITGVTLSALKSGTSTLTVKQDTASAISAMAAFVKAYNELNTQLRDLTAYDAQTKKSALLFGDSGARSLQTALRGMISYAFPGTSTSPRTLSDLGVSLQRDGSLKFDSTKFESALTAAPDTVSDLFTSTSAQGKGLAAHAKELLGQILSTNGILSARTDGLNRSVSDLDHRRERLGLRMTAIEKRYRSQFTSLDTLVASMQKTSQYLTTQLASLSSLNSSK